MTNSQVCQLHKTKTAVSAIVLLLLLLIVQAEAARITYRPNTRMEFDSIRCGGVYNKKGYSVLTRVCEDCYNLYRSSGVYANCTANCFNNALFPTCVSDLMKSHLMEDFSKTIAMANGDY